MKSHKTQKKIYLYKRHYLKGFVQNYEGGCIRQTATYKNTYTTKNNPRENPEVEFYKGLENLNCILVDVVYNVNYVTFNFVNINFYVVLSVVFVNIDTKILIIIEVTKSSTNCVLSSH